MTNPELTAAVERAANECYRHMHHTLGHIDIADFKLHILSELSPVVEMLRIHAKAAMSKGLQNIWEGKSEGIPPDWLIRAMEARTLCDSLAGALEALPHCGHDLHTGENDCPQCLREKSLSAYSKFKEGKL